MPEWTEVLQLEYGKKTKNKKKKKEKQYVQSVFLKIVSNYFEGKYLHGHNISRIIVCDSNLR